MCPMRRFAVLVGILLLMVPLAIAHYSVQGTFDTSRLVTLNGTITDVEWRNPLTYIHVNANDLNGNPTPWVIRLSGARDLAGEGFSRDSFAVGTHVVTEVWLTKAGINGTHIDLSKGERLAAAWTVTLDDGRVLPEASKLGPPWPTEPTIFPSQR